MTGTTENLIAYRDFFVRKIRQTPGIRFINATEGGILRDGVELMGLRDALFQSCRGTIEVRERLAAAYDASTGKQESVVAAIEHLAGVLETRNAECGCLDGFLNLSAKEAVLKGDQQAIEESILWGQRALHTVRCAPAQSAG